MSTIRHILGFYSTTTVAEKSSLEAIIDDVLAEMMRKGSVRISSKQLQDAEPARWLTANVPYSSGFFSDEERQNLYMCKSEYQMYHTKKFDDVDVQAWKARFYARCQSYLKDVCITDVRLQRDQLVSSQAKREEDMQLKFDKQKVQATLARYARIPVEREEYGDMVAAIREEMDALEPARRAANARLLPPE